MYKRQIFYARAFVYWTAGQNETALADLTKAIAHRDDFADAFNLRGVCNVRLKNVELAITDFTRAIELGMDDASAFLNRAKTFLELDLLEFALPDLLDAVERDPEMSTQLQKLVKDLTQELQVRGSSKIYANRALALHYSGCVEPAMKDLSMALSIAQGPQETAMVLSRSAQMRIYDNDFLGAITECSRAVQVDPDCTLAFYLAGLCYSGLGHVEESRTTFIHCQVVAKQQGFAGSEYYRSICQAELGALGAVEAVA